MQPRRKSDLRSTRKHVYRTRVGIIGVYPKLIYSDAHNINFGLPKRLLQAW
jgi:hypothetical protein